MLAATRIRSAAVSGSENSSLVISGSASFLFWSIYCTNRLNEQSLPQFMPNNNGLPMNCTFQLVGVVVEDSLIGACEPSTEPTYSIFRQGVTAANRQTLADNVVSFVRNHCLDGIDFDWEYPGAPDLPGIPAGTDDEGDNYLEFLKLVRAGLPSDTTLSIAAPASYWYLQSFSIANISTVVDYVIYMTHDLHEQWDYDSAWAQDSCPAGNCPRSHVNLTETILSLSMITKAGVATNKVVVGVTSYGRGFEMTDPDCTGPICTYSGPDSGAKPGPYSDIIIYDSTQWVAYMTNTTKSTRTDYYQSLNMAGTSEWAIDLESFGVSSDDDSSMTQRDPCTTKYDSLDAIAANACNIPDYCMNTYIVGVQQATPNEALANYSDIIDHSYDGKFDAYSGYIKELYTTCCKDCGGGCINGCTTGDDCVQGYNNVTTDCPDYIPDFLNDLHKDGIVATTNENNDEDGFHKEIEDLYGSAIVDYLVKSDAGCEGNPNGCDTDIYYYGFPVKTDFDVPNPKDLISSSLTSLTIINQMLVDAYAYADMSVNVWTANESAPVDSATLHSSMTKYAVQSMAKVAKQGAEIEAAEKKEMILSFVLGILFLLPSIGEVIDAAELATLGRAVALAGDAGNVGVGIYGIVEDPKSAVFAVFSLLVGGRRDTEDAMESAKVAWREVSSANIAKLGSDVKAEIDQVDSLKEQIYDSRPLKYI
ncbi:hypothetical protein BDV19DRAFT_391480 [Aspergillus venezuelensis]